MNRNKIVYFPGTYGAFLEFVLNRCLMDTSAPMIDPVSSLGTCHDAVEVMRTDPASTDRFHCFHAAEIENGEKFAVVNFEPEDDVLVMQLLFKRAGDTDIDTEGFEKNTYWKLVNSKVPPLNNWSTNSNSKIIESINKFSDLSPYTNIKDPSWPDINSVEDFYRLPTHIIDECKNVFEFHPFYLSPSTPDAAKWALRQMFKIWFEDPDRLPSSHLRSYVSNPLCYKLMLNDMYDINKFKNALTNLAQYFDIDINLNNFPQDTYDRVVLATAYKNTRQKCEQVIENVVKGISIAINLNIFEEAYVCVLLERQFGLTFPMHKENFFTNTAEIIQLI